MNYSSETECLTIDLILKVKKLKRIIAVLVVIVILAIGWCLQGITSNSNKEEQVTSVQEEDQDPGMTDKLLMAKDILSTRYYSKSKMESVFKRELGDLYNKNSKSNFDNYCISLILRSLDEEEEYQWMGYNAIAEIETQTKSDSTSLDDMENVSVSNASSSVDINKSNTLYLRLPEFYEDMAKDVLFKYMEGFKCKENIILDLRDNPGGCVNEVDQLAGIFIDSNRTIYKVRNSEETIDVVSASISKFEFKKIIIIINENTASAAEMLALALKRNLQGVEIIGEQSYGKGILTETFPFDDKTSLTIITYKWLDSLGKSIHNEGIKPDIVVKAGDDTKDVQLEKAFELCK